MSLFPKKKVEYPFNPLIQWSLAKYHIFKEKTNETWLTAMHFNGRGSRECLGVLG